MTEIERLARSVGGVAYCQIKVRDGEPDKKSTVYVPTWAAAMIVRAILQAMREPSEGMINAGQDSGKFERLWDDDVTATWQAMIDHILSEPDK